ncbi:MAG: VOC family protein, partial [Chitinophagaceae bacterium]|nr:VOC family protein [Rubrivivax sp.]
MWWPAFRGRSNCEPACDPAAANTTGRAPGRRKPVRRPLGGRADIPVGRGTPLSTALVDHLVVAATSLDQGVAWCEATLGVTPGPGGKHALMGTHNRLLKISTETFPNCFLEIIAIDPDAPPPGRARWFGLDGLDLSSGPRLVTFVARTS